MGTMFVGPGAIILAPSRTLCLTLEVVNGNICVLDGKRRVVRKSEKRLWENLTKGRSGIPGSGKPSDC